MIIERVKELGATALTITHDMASARTIASKIYMLHAGNIIWDGNVNELETTDNSWLSGETKFGKNHMKIDTLLSSST